MVPRCQDTATGDKEEAEEDLSPLPVESKTHLSDIISYL